MNRIPETTDPSGNARFVLSCNHDPFRILNDQPKGNPYKFWQEGVTGS